MTHVKAAERLIATSFVGAMANLNPKTTGIPHVVVWISKKEPTHACRVKVSNIRGKFSGEDNFSIALHDESIEGEVKVSPKDVKAVIEWMNLNRKVILKYWNDPEFDVAELLAKLKKI